LFLRDLGQTEVGGFGITAAGDLLYVSDIQLVKQVCTGVSVRFDDASVADFFDRQVDLGRKPTEFSRLWLHTHPGACPQPSLTDEQTFARAFGKTDWAIMFILACGGQTYCRLEFHVGPGGAILLPVEVDFTLPFPAADQAAWREEYLASVQEEPLLLDLAASRLERDLGHFGAHRAPLASLVGWDGFLEEDLDHGLVEVHHPFAEGDFLDDDF
jgi:hypothetical protein